MNYKKLYDLLILKRQLFPLIRYKKCDPLYLYVEEHHILPQSLGGSNLKDNLILLTAKEHFIAHLLLVKSYQKYEDKTSYYKMCKAMSFFMCQSKDGIDRLKIIGNKIHSKQFEKLCIEGRKSTSKSMKRFMKEFKPNNGRKWITNEYKNKFLKFVDAENFLKEHSDWHYGQKFVHRSISEQTKTNRLQGMKKSIKYQNRFND